MVKQESSKYDKVIEYAIKRGILWQSYEIYGGQAGFYDLGPLGVLLKNNVIDLWREYFVRMHQDMVVEIETPIITPAIVLRASGHEEHFMDFAVECTKCRRIFRADHLLEEVLGVPTEGLGAEALEALIRERGVKCPACGGELGGVKRFPLLFQTYIGPYSPENLAYLRPEAAQGMFVNFKRVYEFMRRRLPFGIAQIGRVARNEISPRQGPIRLREFTIMEIEFFYDDLNPCHDILYERCANERLALLLAEQRERGESRPITLSAVEAVDERIVKSPWLGYWMCISSKFIKALGVPPERTYFEEKLPSERAHYSLQTFDQIVFVDKWGKLEVSGHAYRHTYDLVRHMEFSNAELYAIRMLKQPRVVRKRVVKYDKAAILKYFGPQAPRVFKALASMSEEELGELVEKAGGEFVTIGDIEIPKELLKVSYIEEELWTEKVIPHVAEPSFGAERLMYVVLEYAYTEVDGRVVMKYPPRLAPIKVGIASLVDREPLESLASKVYEMLKRELHVLYLEGDSIGRKYALGDELGIPYIVTVDYLSLEDNMVTVRDRDTKKQIRVPLDELLTVLRRGLSGGDIFSLGYKVVEYRHVA